MLVLNNTFSITCRDEKFCVSSEERVQRVTASPRRRKILRLYSACFFLILVLPLISFAQSEDSLPKQIPKEITYAYDLEDARIDFPIDTGLSKFHYYDPVDRLDFLYRNTGALGSASFRMVCCPEQQMGFRMGFHQFNLYRFSESNVPFYKNVRPYSQLNLLIGLKREQTAAVTHSQNIGRKFNFGFHYMRFATIGTYVNQRTRHNDIAFTTTFDSKKRYLLKTFLTYNYIRAEENGGVKQTSIYDDTSFISKELVKVELENAETRQREISFHLRQSIRNKTPARDTVSTDSTAVVQLSTPGPKWEVYHEVEVGRERYQYTDGAPDSAFYGLLLPAEDSLAQSVRYEAQNIFAGTKAGLRKSFGKAFTVDASSSYFIHLIEQDSFSNGHTHYADAKLAFESDVSLPFTYSASAAYSFVGYNEGDFKADAALNYVFKKTNVLQANAVYSRVEPALIYQRFTFGRTQWAADLEKQSQLTVQLRYVQRKYNFHAAVRFSQLNQYLYFDSNKLPAQHDGSLQALVFELHKLFRFNYFGFDNTLYVQVLSDKDLLRYPIYWGVHSFYYERGVFKNKLLTRIGFDIRYNTNYAAPGYFPLTGQFYLQDAEQLNFYPVLDLYVCFKVKTARMFFKMQHLNQGMFKDKGYFNAYKYPGIDRTFRFGLSWMFLD